MSDQGKSNINKQQHYILSNRGVVNRDNGASSMNRSGQYQGSQNLQSNDLETAFEKKLGISNMMALAEASAGDRRSYPRVASTSSKHAFALQNIRKDLEDMPQQQMSNWQHSFDNELSKSDYRSNSYTDLHQSHRSTDLSILMSYGLDENSAKEALCLYPNKSIDYIIDLLKRNNVFNNTHRATPTQRLFGVTQNGPRSQNIPMTNGRSALHNNGQPTMRYQSETLRSHNANDGVGFQVSAQYPERPISGSYMSDGDTISLDSGMSQSSRYYDKPSVTLRQKPDRALANQQRPWSVEILHKNVMDESNKRSYMEAYAHKPPPPYPGSTKNSLNRISSQEGEFQAVKNTPITVIFDQENERVNVVGGIPDGFESTNPSSSSSGQSSPPASQKHPPPYNYLKQYNNPPNGQQKSSHSKPPVVVQGNFNTNKKPTVTYAIPTPNASKSSVDEKFKPISESLKSDRGSPPPYPGSNSSTTSSNRVSLNVDDLESSVGYYSTQSSSQSAASSVKDNDSTSSTSPVPGDDVERSYSPLPVIQSLTLNSNYDKTMIIHQKNQIDFDEVSTDETDEAFSTRLKHYTPQAYKFYMEQHVENLFKQQEQRKIRRQQLEAEMSRVRLPIQAQEQMRKLLNQKESNYIRLRRAKMDKSMFTKIKVVGVGAFGEVSLVRKKETNAYYAMKTLRKSEVLRRNQVAHVKAERDILAEADNEWVVKLYYSFQNQQYLYFVMDYVPGGDLMALLIKFGIFNEPLARFYISELVLAIESVHKLGFIHRDIKPDNILIDKNGHIKLTDFGLCTGFRWTHDSKYYQPEPEGGGHTRQYSMEPEGGWESLMDDTNCNCKNHRMQYDLLKPLQRRKLRRHMRCQAHSLVGTPNYIAPEVLMRIPYGQQCDWWSVGVIMYEMLIGQPPFLAQSPAETQFKVINWRQILNIPRNRLEPEAEDLIRKLCSDPNERIGKDDAEQIKLHPYFDGVDFLTLHAEKAPHVPTIKNATDTSNFDPVPEAMIEDDFEDHAEKNNVKTNKEGPEYAFYEFTFRHFFDDGGLVNPNPNTEFEVSETNENPKQASKRGAASVGNNSMTVPSKVSASSSSTSEEKTPIYV